jgi:hypothetical protein
MPDDLAELGTPPGTPVPDDALADLTDEEQAAMIEDTGNPPDPGDTRRPVAPRKAPAP